MQTLPVHGSCSITSAVMCSLESHSVVNGVVQIMLLDKPCVCWRCFLIGSSTFLHCLLFNCFTYRPHPTFVVIR